MGLDDLDMGSNDRRQRRLSTSISSTLTPSTKPRSLENAWKKPNSSLPCAGTGTSRPLRRIARTWLSTTNRPCNTAVDGRIPVRSNVVRNV